MYFICYNQLEYKGGKCYDFYCGRSKVWQVDFGEKIEIKVSKFQYNQLRGGKEVCWGYGAYWGGYFIK